MSECNFHVGQPIICIGQPECVKSIKYPVGSTVFHIREVVVCPITEEVGLRLAEMYLPIHPRYGQELLFLPEYFRAVNQRKTDISIFKAMLTPSKEQVSA